MKLNMDLETMRVLAARLQEEQPGSVLAGVRQQLQEHLKPKPRQQLTSEELDEVVLLVGAAIGNQRWTKAIHPDGLKFDLLQSAMVKLEGMLQRQLAREQAETQGGRDDGKNSTR